MIVELFCEECERGQNEAQQCVDCKKCEREMTAKKALIAVNFACEEQEPIYLAMPYKHTIIPILDNVLEPQTPNAMLAISFPDGVLTVDCNYLDGDEGINVVGEGTIVPYAEFIAELKEQHDNHIKCITEELLIVPETPKQNGKIVGVAWGTEKGVKYYANTFCDCPEHFGDCEAIISFGEDLSAEGAERIAIEKAKELGVPCVRW
jgi:hypothetical protein